MESTVKVECAKDLAFDENGVSGKSSCRDVRVLPEEIREQYPFESNFFDIDGNLMHYLDEGEGEVIVMVHGNPTWSFYYRNLVLALRSDYRCIVPDHIGCGLSDKPQDYSYTLKQHVENLSQLIESLGIKRFHLMVHDWGGPIGFGMALKLRQRVGKIVVTNTSVFRSKHMPFQLHLCRLPFLGKLLIQGFNAFAGLAVSMAVKRKMRKEVAAGFLFPYDCWPNRIAVYQFVQDIPMSAAHPTYSTLGNIEANACLLGENDMLVCWGGQDFVFTDHFFDGFKERFPEARFVYHSDAGHYLLEDARDSVISEVKAFLSKGRT